MASRFLTPAASVPGTHGGQCVARAGCYYWASAAAAALYVLLAPAAVRAGTIGQLVTSACPSMSDEFAEANNGKEELDLGNMASGASHYKRAARIAYDCTKTTHGYAHDWIEFFYATALANSAVTDKQQVDVDSIVSYAMNDLAADTKYSDVRQSALKLRSVVRSELARMSGTPATTSSDEAESSQAKSTTLDGGSCEPASWYLKNELDASTAAVAGDSTKAYALYQQSAEWRGSCADNASGESNTWQLLHEADDISGEAVNVDDQGQTNGLWSSAITIFNEACANGVIGSSLIKSFADGLQKQLANVPPEYPTDYPIAADSCGGS